jgi:hypothetical protein
MQKLLLQQYKSADEKEQHKLCNITEVLACIFNDHQNTEEPKAQNLMKGGCAWYTRRRKQIM